MDKKLERLDELKRQHFTPEGRKARIRKSLKALRKASPTKLTAEQIKQVIDEIERP